MQRIFLIDRKDRVPRILVWLFLPAAISILALSAYSLIFSIVLGPSSDFNFLLHLPLTNRNCSDCMGCIYGHRGCSSLVCYVGLLGDKREIISQSQSCMVSSFALGDALWRSDLSDLHLEERHPQYFI